MSRFFAELFCGFPGIFDAAVQTKGLPKIVFSQGQMSHFCFSKDNVLSSLYFFINLCYLYYY